MDTDGERPDLPARYKFGARLSHWRRCRHLSIKELAVLLEISPEDLAGLEESNAVVATEVLHQLTLLGAPVHQFFDEAPRLFPAISSDGLPVMSSMQIVKKEKIQQGVVNIDKSYPYYYSHAPDPDKLWRVFEWPYHPLNPWDRGKYHIICTKIIAIDEFDVLNEALLIITEHEIVCGWGTAIETDLLHLVTYDLQMQEIKKEITFSGKFDVWSVGMVVKVDE